MAKVTVDSLEGLAFSCLLAIMAGILLTNPDVPPTSGWYVWALFVVASGLAISPPARFNARDLLRIGIPPALCLLFTMSIRGAVSVLTNAAIASVASMELSAAEVIEREALMRIAALYALIFLGSIPAVVLASLARGIIWFGLKRLWDADPDHVGRLEKVVNTSLRILAVLGGGYLLHSGT